MQKIGNVLIVDDHPMIRFAVKTILEQNGWNVIAEADTGVDALTLARKHRPDLIVLDIGIPKMDGLMVISRLRAEGPDPTSPGIIVLSAQSPEHLATRCLHAGAMGFVYKGKELHELVNAAKAVRQGNIYFPSLAFAPTKDHDTALGEPGLIKQLSDRELVVLQLLARGTSNKTIATTLMLSEKTVSTYKRRLQEKLNASSLLELTDLARRNALV